MMNRKSTHLVRATLAALVLTIAPLAVSVEADAATVTVHAVELSSSGTPAPYYNSTGMLCEATDSSGGSTSWIPGGTRIQSDARVYWSNAGDTRYYETANVTSYLYWYGNGKWNYWMPASQSYSVSPYYPSSVATHFDFTGLPRGYWYKVETAITWTQGGRTLGSALYGLTQGGVAYINEPVSYMTLSNGAAACEFN
jgi:hypothetical protein